MKSKVLAMLSVLAITGVAQAAPHGMLLTQQQRLLNSIQGKPGIGVLDDTKTKMLYYGGPVIGNVKVYAVYWGKGVDSVVQEKIPGFFKEVTNSSFLDWLDKEYNTRGISSVTDHGSTNQSIGRGSYAGAITITPSNTKTALDDKDLQVELEQQVTAGQLPKPNADTIFFLYFPPGISISVDGQASCAQFCAYHEGYVSKTYGSIFYGVMPDLGGACAWGCGFGASPFDNMTSVTSHELMEAITDPFPTPGDKPGYPQAWNTTDGQEVGDVCQDNTSLTTATGVSYNLQQIWQNSIGGCNPGPFQSP